MDQVYANDRLWSCCETVHRLISVEAQESHVDSSLLGRIHRPVPQAQSLWEDIQLALMRTRSPLTKLNKIFFH